MRETSSCYTFGSYSYYIFVGCCIAILYIRIVYRSNPGKHWRDHRSIHQNIIPATTGSCKALAKIIPQVKDKMTGLAFRVPIVNVSVLDMTVRLDTHTNLQDIFKTVEKASKSFLQNIIKISNEEAVSSDFSGDSHSCILDADSSLQLKPDFFKIICWYENEYSYACRVLDSIFFSERQFNKPVTLPCKMTYVRAKITKKQDKVQQTERKAKEMPPMECNAEVTKICTSAQETTCKGKSLIRPVVLRKPLSSHSPGTPPTAPAVNRDAKKRNDLFKIWTDNNDTKKDAAIQNRITYFQSCMAFGPKQTEDTDCMNAQERLENVKREFSKMVNITEDLLKKSNANKLQLGLVTKSSLEGVKLVANGGSKDSKTVIKLNNPQANNSIFDICGDYKNKLATSPTDSNCEEVRCSSSTGRKENNTEYNIASAVKQIVTNNKPFLIPSREKITCFAKQMSASYFGPMAAVQNSLPAKANGSLKKSTFMNSAMNIKGHMTKTATYLKKSSNESSVQCAIKEHKEIPPKISDNVVKELVKEKQLEVKFTEGSRPPQAPTERKACKIQEPDPTETMHDKDFNKYLHKKDYNMRVIDEELQKRNILLVNNQKHNTEVNLKSCNMSIKYREQLVKETETRSKNLKKQILESLSRKFVGPVAMVPEKTSGCCSPDGTATTVSNGNGTRNKPDLYDKLDSASATDSTNSFEINERQSQVLQISDLTTSLEDLGRLDKICRIIEISDELSDKLFSSLDQPELMGLHQKKWSFRDLCERIQLDDFCDNVFGKSRI